MNMGFFKRKKEEEISDEEFEDIELPPLPTDLPKMPATPQIPPIRGLSDFSEMDAHPFPPSHQAPRMQGPLPVGPLNVPKMPVMNRPRMVPEEIQPNMVSKKPVEQRYTPMPDKRAQVFVRIDKYRQAIKTIENMQRKMAELQDTLKKISVIKNKEAEIIEGWAALLMEAKDKIDDVNTKLLRPSNL
jgi:hypothetical protein